MIYNLQKMNMMNILHANLNIKKHPPYDGKEPLLHVVHLSELHDLHPDPNTLHEIQTPSYSKESLLLLQPVFNELFVTDILIQYFFII